MVECCVHESYPVPSLWVQWGFKMKNKVPPSEVQRIINRLGSIPTLRDLTLVLNIPTFKNRPLQISLQPLANLNRVTFIWKGALDPSSTIMVELSTLLQRCPDLELLRFDNDISVELAPPIGLGDLLKGLSTADFSLRLRELYLTRVKFAPEVFISHLRHFQHLQVLSVRHDPDPSRAAFIGGICDILQKEQIHLKSLSTDAVNHPSLFSYLSSYSGLETLSVRPRTRPEDSLALVDQFFCSIIPRHFQSLRKLEVGSSTATAWTEVWEERHMAGIKKCQNLTDLKYNMTVSFDEMPTRESPLLVRWP